MLIKYTGLKPSKTLEINTAAFGTKRYIFAPALEVNELTDSELVAFCLSPDRKGLFAVEEEPEPILGIEKKLIVTQEEPAVSHETHVGIGINPEAAEKPKRRGRPRKA